MQKVKKAMLLVVLTAPVLGGCHSIFGGSHGSRAELQIPAAPDPAVYAVTQMAEGKVALDNGEYGRAIVAFRNAKQFPEHAAGAYNGMAIAYSNLGRQDLAERYFRTAVETDPGNKRYQANLARFYRANPITGIRPARSKARETVIEPAQAALDRANVQILVGNGSRTGIKVETPASRMVRLSDREVFIGAASGASDPRRRDMRSVAAVTVRKPGRRKNPNYPVQVSLAPETPTVTTSSPAQVADANYPIRVMLTPAK